MELFEKYKFNVHSITIKSSIQQLGLQIVIIFWFQSEMEFYIQIISKWRTSVSDFYNIYNTSMFSYIGIMDSRTSLHERGEFRYSIIVETFILWNYSSFNKIFLWRVWTIYCLWENSLIIYIILRICYNIIVNCSYSKAILYGSKLIQRFHLISSIINILWNAYINLSYRWTILLSHQISYQSFFEWQSKIMFVKP